MKNSFKIWWKNFLECNEKHIFNSINKTNLNVINDIKWNYIKYFKPNYIKISVKYNKLNIKIVLKYFIWNLMEMFIEIPLIIE